MTRQEFIDEVQCIGDFHDWCYDHDEDWVIEDWVLEDCLSDEIDNDVREMIDNESWETLRDCLNEVNTQSDTGWFRKEGWLDYSPISEDELDDLKERILDRYDENGWWDDEDGDGDDDEGQAEEDEAAASGIDWDDWDTAIETPEPAQPEHEEEKTKTAIEIFLCGGE